MNRWPSSGRTGAISSNTKRGSSLRETMKSRGSRKTAIRCISSPSLWINKVCGAERAMSMLPAFDCGWLNALHQIYLSSWAVIDCGRIKKRMKGLEEVALYRLAIDGARTIVYFAYMLVIYYDKYYDSTMIKQKPLGLIFSCVYRFIDV